MLGGDERAMMDRTVGSRYVVQDVYVGELTTARVCSPECSMSGSVFPSLVNLVPPDFLLHSLGPVCTALSPMHPPGKDPVYPEHTGCYKLQPCTWPSCLP